MNLFRGKEILRNRLRSLVQRARVEEELDKELHFHLEQQTEEHLAHGMPLAEARLAALRELGGVAQIQEECRDMRRTNHLEDFLHDLRYAVRTLGRSPGFAAVIILTMALSIGANSAIFSVIDGVLLKPLPYVQPNRLVRFFLTNAEYPKFPINPFDFRDYRTRSRSFESLAAYTRNDLQLSGTGEPVRLAGFSITAGFFRVLGLYPAMGREFSTRDELPGNGHQVILSYNLWRTRFGGRRDVIGQKITLGGVPLTVVGVMPRGVQHPGNMYHALAYGETVDVWTPFTFQGNPSQRGSHYMDAIARLKNGVTPSQAQGELEVTMAQLGREHEQARGYRVLVVPLQREIVGRSQRMLLVLLGAVGMVLLIACVNAANLLLARATARQREIAVRAALGARRSRLIRQMLTESVIISLVGAIFGAGIAIGGVKALVSLLPADFPRGSDIRVNTAVFLFTLAIALATGILFGLAPALQGSRSDLRGSLHESGRSTTSSSGSLRLRNIFVVSEVALACILLIGAGLMLHSFVNLLYTDPGFRPDRVLTAGISLPEVRYKTSAAVKQFYDRLLTNVASTPEVRAAGVGTDLPWTGYDENLGGFNIEGKKPPPHQEFHARYHVASADYFRALGIPLLRGRFFDAHDNQGGVPVLIINESMARRYWPGENALGRRVSFEDQPKEKDWLTIVGIVGDVKDTPASNGAEPAFWWPLLQQPGPLSADAAIAMRGAGDARLLANRLRESVHKLDPDLAVANIGQMEDVADRSYSAPRFALFLVALFACLALTLAAIGTFGVISYAVNRREHEFGVRMALGANASDVITSVLSEGMRLALAGVLAGVAFGLALGRLLGSLLYEVSAKDPLSIAIACLIALAAAAVASYIPALRATHCDPINALRAE